jgi:hypothetical protein
MSMDSMHLSYNVFLVDKEFNDNMVLWDWHQEDLLDGFLWPSFSMYLEFLDFIIFIFYLTILII